MLVACTRRSSAPRLSCSRPVATTVTAVTSATPIVRASAVTAVRPGLRIALRRASAPAAPPSRGRRAADEEASARTPRASRPGRGGVGALAQRGDRRDLRRAPRRDHRREHGGDGADGEQDGSPCASRAVVDSVGRSAPTAVKSAFKPTASPTPTAMPGAPRRAGRSSAPRAGPRRGPAGAWRRPSAQPELLRALRDGDTSAS